MTRGEQYDRLGALFRGLVGLELKSPSEQLLPGDIRLGLVAEHAFINNSDQLELQSYWTSKETGILGRHFLASFELLNWTADPTASWSTKSWTGLSNVTTHWTGWTCWPRSSYYYSWQTTSCTIIAGRDRKQLTGISCSSQSRVAGVRDMTMSREKLTQTIWPLRPPIRQQHVSSP